MLEVSFAAALFGGLISFLSPCVLPLVPPYLSYLAGVTLDEMQARDDWAVRRRAILTALLFVAGFTTVFVLLGATASALGNVVRQHIGLLSTLAGAAIIVMGLHFMGLFRIGFLYREARLTVDKSLDVWGAYVMGLAFAFGGPPGTARSSPRSSPSPAPRRASGAVRRCSPSTRPASASRSSSRRSP